MSDVIRAVDEGDDFIAFSDEWSTDDRFEKGSWYRTLDISADETGSTIVSRECVGTDLDNHRVYTDLEINLSLQETKQLIKFLQEQIGEEK